MESVAVVGMRGKGRSRRRGAAGASVEEAGMRAREVGVREGGRRRPDRLPLKFTLALLPEVVGGKAEVTPGERGVPHPSPPKPQAHP